MTLITLKWTNDISALCKMPLSQVKAHTWVPSLFNNKALTLSVCPLSFISFAQVLGSHTLRTYGSRHGINDINTILPTNVLPLQKLSLSRWINLYSEHVDIYHWKYMLEEDRHNYILCSSNKQMWSSPDFNLSCSGFFCLKEIKEWKWPETGQCDVGKKCASENPLRCFTGILYLFLYCLGNKILSRLN